MRARAASMVAISMAVAVLATGVAAAEPKPKPVDIKPIRDKLQVFTDPDGGTYVASPGRDGRLFYGVPKSKNLYEQLVTGRFTDESQGKWDLSVYAPRVPNFQPGSIGRREDGTFYRYCGSDNATVTLTEVTGEKARIVLDKSSFMSSAMIRRPHMLARDDAGVYYYVDVIRKEYGGKGYRVFVGKKGAMKQRPLTDIATDTGGDVFATKTGDLRIVRDTTDSKVTWVKGEKRTQLVSLDTDANSVLIFRDLGVYAFTGNICENY